MSSDSEDDAYGPPLPPSFKSKIESKSKDEIPGKGKAGRNDDLGNSDENSSDSGSYGPALPPHMQKRNDEIIVRDASKPSLQLQGLKRKEVEGEGHQIKIVKRDVEDESSEDEDMYGPALPPHLIKNKDSESSLQKKERILGPSLPPGFIPPKEAIPPTEEHSDEEGDDTGSEDEEGPAIGPVPSAVAFDEEAYRIQQLELRARRMKDKLEGKLDDNKPVKRETWMLELPEDKANFCGLAPRKFLKKAPQEKGDRSIWTDTPADKERKSKMDADEVSEVEIKSAVSKKRDEDLTGMVDDYNKEKRAKPLIDLHKKKLKEMEKSSGPKERRPFSREDDMNVNKFDEAQKDNILKKARQLNDRFGAGDRKFL